jgi:hypothetical protein
LIVVFAFYYESDISESATVKIYYGVGEIIYGPKGVDLSNFSSVEKNILRAGERTWEVITNWLGKVFSVDFEHHSMSVNALINRSTPVYWELVALEGSTMEGFYQKCMPSWFAYDFVCPNLSQGWV